LAEGPKSKPQSELGEALQVAPFEQRKAQTRHAPAVPDFQVDSEPSESKKDRHERKVREEEDRFATAKMI
jgi:hypothetical protein